MTSRSLGLNVFAMWYRKSTFLKIKRDAFDVVKHNQKMCDVIYKQRSI